MSASRSGSMDKVGRSEVLDQTEPCSADPEPWPFRPLQVREEAAMASAQWSYAPWSAHPCCAAALSDHANLSDLRTSRRDAFPPGSGPGCDRRYRCVASWSAAPRATEMARHAARRCGSALEPARAHDPTDQRTHRRPPYENACHSTDATSRKVDEL